MDGLTAGDDGLCIWSGGQGEDCERDGNYPVKDPDGTLTEVRVSALNSSAYLYCLWPLLRTPIRTLGGFHKLVQ